MSYKNPSDQTLKTYLENSKTIAVLGLSDKEEKASYRVAKYLQEKGYRIYPVNPHKAGQTILGQEVYASLQDLPDGIDMVNVFRPSQELVQVAQDFLETDIPLFWVQLGLENQEAASFIEAAGRQKPVMDRCIKVEHQRLLV